MTLDINHSGLLAPDVVSGFVGTLGRCVYVFSVLLK